MTDRKSCALAWCTAPHDDDSERVSYHRAVIADQTIDATTVGVVALWAERFAGGAGVEPHIAVVASASPDPLHIDLTPREASAFSALLSLLGGPEWLAEALATGARMLDPHDDQDHDGEPHRVVDNPPQRTGADRFDWSLIIGVFDVLEARGYRKGDDQHTGRAIGLLADLVDVYEGSEQ
jgi:hypothetical protein